MSGRVFFEDVIRENLDIGRPGQVQLIFDWRVSKRTPGRFRTRVITDGVTPSLHVDYKHSRIKQYHKHNQALRTETPSTILATSPSAGGCITWRRCARSALTPTDACSRSKRSATTVPWAKPISNAISDPWRSTGNALRRYVSPIRACRP